MFREDGDDQSVSKPEYEDTSDQASTLVNKKRLSFTTAFSLGVEVFAKIVPLLVLHFAQKALGVKAFGLSQYGIALVEIAIPFVIFGYHNYGAVLVGQVSKEPGKIARLISNITCLKLLHAVVTLGFMTLVLGASEVYRPYLPMMLALSFVMFTGAFDCFWTHLGVQKFAWVQGFIGVGKIISLVLVVLLVTHPEDSALYAALTFLANSCLHLATFVYCTKRFGIARPRWSEMTQLFVRARPYALVVILGIFADRLDWILVERLFGLRETGLYAGSARLNHSVFQLFNAITLSFFAEMLVCHDKKSLTRHFELGLWVMTSLFAPVLVGMIFVGRDVLGLIYGADFVGQEAPLLALLASTWFGTLGAMLSLQILQIRGATKPVLWALVAGTTVMTALIPALAQTLQLVGVAVSVLVGKALSAGLMLIAARRYLSQLPWGAVLRPMLAAAVMGLVLAGLGEMTFAKTVLVGGLSFAPVYLLLNWAYLRRCT